MSVYDDIKQDVLRKCYERLYVERHNLYDEDDILDIIDDFPIPGDSESLLRFVLCQPSILKGVSPDTTNDDLQFCVSSYLYNDVRSIVRDIPVWEGIVKRNKIMGTKLMEMCLRRVSYSGMGADIINNESETTKIIKDAIQKDWTPIRTETPPSNSGVVVVDIDALLYWLVGSFNGRWMDNSNTDPFDMMLNYSVGNFVYEAFYHGCPEDPNIWCYMFNEEPDVISSGDMYRPTHWTLTETLSQKIESMWLHSPPF